MPAPKDPTKYLDWKEKIRKAHIGMHHTLETRMKISKNNAKNGLGTKFSEERKNQMREISIRLKLRPPSRKGIRWSIKDRRRARDIRKGALSPNWKGGLTKKSLSIRHSLKYRLWRKAVFKRDDWRCQDFECRKRGGKLNADHILPFSRYPKERFKIWNGRTLCVDCHKKTWTYLFNPRKKLDPIFKELVDKLL